MENKLSRKLSLIFVNFITLIRLIGAIFLPFLYHYKSAADFAIITLILFLTDSIDGFFARLLKVPTFFGTAMDAACDKVLNVNAFILLSLTYNSMLLPLILEIIILYTVYSTYKHGGNVQSIKIGKIKTIILDIFVIFSFCLISLSKFNNNKLNFLIDKTPCLINIFSIIITIACVIALIGYIKINKDARIKNKNKVIKNNKSNRKSRKDAFRDAFDTEYYLKHKNESIMKQLYY